MKKRILVLVTALLAAVLMLSACSSGIKSTDEEARVVGKCGDYEIKYEELRYLTLTCKAALAEKYGEEIFSEASSEWIGEYTKELEETVIKQLCQNYASVEVFKANRIKTSDRVTKQYVESYVSQIMSDFDSEEEYVAFLNECYMTDSVLRFNSALESCFYRYYEAVAEKYDAEAYDAVMAKDGFVRTMSIFIKNDKGESVAKNRQDAEAVREQIVSGKPLSSFIGSKYNQDTGLCDYYFMRGYMDKAYEDAAFELEIGEISPVVETADGFYIIQRMEMSDTYMLGNIEALKNVYFECKMYEEINTFVENMNFEFNEYGKTLSLWDME